jgi:multiple antibiotic resistance protein
MLDNAYTDLITLIVTIDPVGTVPLFLGVAGRRPSQEIAKLANQSVLVAGGVLIGFLLLGQVLLTSMHISMDSFQVAGGLVLFLFAMTMVFGHHVSNGSSGGAEDNPAIFPLGMPTIAGPGAILAIVVLTDNDRYNCLHQARTGFVMLGVLLLQWVLLRLAVPIQKRLGAGGASILTRVMGLILASLSVETVVTGIRGMMKAAGEVVGAQAFVVGS